MVLSIISIIIAGLAVRVSKQSNKLSKETHNENKQINLKLRLADEIHETRTLLNKLSILDISVTSKDELSKGLRKNTITMINALTSIIPLPEEVTTYKKSLEEVYPLALNATEQAHNKIRESFRSYEIDIQEISNTETPSIETIDKVIKLKTLTQRTLDNFCQIESEINKLIDQLIKIQDAIKQHLQTISSGH